jgi:hypothetical protein
VGYLRALFSSCLVLLVSFASTAQQSATAEKSDLPATFDLLETKVRFESNGDSRKEVHAIVKIHSELGARQFANLNFDFNRSFQSVEIPLVRITHASGGTADILPSAITDSPNPAVVNFPAYHDVRVKSVRILGLAPGDTLEYRVITTTTHHPLAPDFWLDHSFDRTGIVSHEIFDVDIPTDRQPHVRFSPKTAPSMTDHQNGRNDYRWDLQSRNPSSTHDSSSGNDEPKESDLAITSFQSWDQFSNRLYSALLRPDQETAAAQKKASELTSSGMGINGPGSLEKIYDFVSQKITTVDLPLGATGFRPRSPDEILESGYGTPEDKSVLMRALTGFAGGAATLSLVQSASMQETAGMPRPSVFDHVLGVLFPGHWKGVWVDTSLGVAPFGLISGQLRGKPALLLTGNDSSWGRVSEELPFPASQSVSIEATIGTNGTLISRVRYKMRGDNELLLRLAFHQSPREKWTEVAQLLALSDGFRGKVTSASASDPYATHDPFTVEYEITQPKFVDWSKSPVRIPAILPLVGLPDPPSAKSASGSPTSTIAPIELGTPLDVHTSVTLHLPAATTVESPAGTAVDRDYATFSSSYAANGGTITASRHIRFIAPELPANRASDYNAFVHAVQNDQAQRFTLFAPPAKQPPSGRPQIQDDRYDRHAQIRNPVETSIRKELAGSEWPKHWAPASTFSFLTFNFNCRL